MLHGIGLRVYAEGVTDVDDAAALWAVGVDGLTGPVLQASRPA
jgi:EAL domain-containing protein (putative c-di-GMP-specific phosphodiesterase class I)